MTAIKSEQGKTLHEVYDFVGRLSEGLHVVSLRSEWFHVTPDGKAAYPERYDYAGDFVNGRAAVRDKAGNCFHIRRKDFARAYAENYVRVDSLKHGRAWARTSDGREICINMDGIEIPDADVLPFE